MDSIQTPAYIHRPEDFPPFIVNSSSKYISHFREQFVFFQFNLTKKLNTEDFELLFHRFVQVLSLLKKQRKQKTVSGGVF